MAGAVFLGTPHQGSDYAGTLEWLAKACGNDQPLLETLKTGSCDLLYLSRDFWSGYERLPIMCFYEREDSRYGPLRTKTVAFNSAAITGERVMYLNTDHSGLNKFRGEEDENFQPFIQEIAAIVEYAVARKHEVNVHGGSKMVMPFPKDPDFTGRENIIAQIGDRLTHLESSPRVALFGPGGVGKSQIAIEYAHRTRDRYPETSIFWVYASNPSRFRSSYLSIAMELGLPSTGDSKSDLEKVYSWLMSRQSGRWLMIVDNADDSTFAYPHHDCNFPQKHEFTIAQYLPQRAGGTIVMTTRNRDAAIGLVHKPIQVLEVQPMTDTEALTLLRTKMLHSHTNEEHERELVLELGSIPLAISQAAAYLSRRRRTTILAYLALLRQDERAGASLLSVEEGDLRRDLDASNSVIRTWEISFDAIRTQNATAADVLSYLCMFDRQNIPEFLIQGDLDTVTSDNAIELLLAFSIIRIDSNETFEMHRLVQLATRTWLRVNKKFDIYSHAAVDILAGHYPDGKYKTWKTCQLLEPHAESVLAHDCCTKEYRLLRADILYKRSYYFYLHNELNAAEIHALECREIRDEFCTGEQDKKVIRSLNLLAMVYTIQGRTSESKDLMMKVIEGTRRIYGEDSGHMLNAWSNLVRVYTDGQDLKRAETLATVVMTKRKIKSGMHDKRTIHAIDDLARIYYRQRRYEEARPLLEQVVHAFEDTFGKEHNHTVDATHNLACTYGELGQREDCERTWVEVVELSKRVYGEKRPQTIRYMTSLSKAQSLNGRESVAIETLSRALQLVRDTNYTNMDEIRGWETRLQELKDLAREESLARAEPS